MSNAITKHCMALLKEASDMFEETGCYLVLMERKCQQKGWCQTRRNTSQRQLTTRRQSTTRQYGIHMDLPWSFRGFPKNGNEDAKDSRHGEQKPGAASDQRATK